MAEMHSPTTGHGPANVEQTDVNVNAIFLLGAGLTSLVVFACLTMWGLFDYLSAREKERKKSDYTLAVAERQRLRQLPLTERLPPAPTLDGLSSPANLDHPLMSGVAAWPSPAPEQRERENAILAKPAWADQKAGTVLLPIDVVMSRLARNLPSRSSDPRRDRERYYQTPSSANSGRPPEGGDK